MTNLKGTRNETVFVRWARDHGFPWADRIPRSGARDRGDVALAPGVIVEVKAWDLSNVVPTAGQLDDWMRQTDVERRNAGADVAILVVKRKGTQDAGRWFAYLRAGTFVDVVISGARARSYVSSHFDPDAPICMSVASLATLLRAGGYGTPPGAVVVR